MLAARQMVRVLADEKETQFMVLHEHASDGEGHDGHTHASIWPGALALVAMLALFVGFEFAATLWLGDAEKDMRLAFSLVRIGFSLAVGFAVGVLVIRHRHLVLPTEAHEDHRILHAPYPLMERRAYFNQLYIRTRWVVCVTILALLAVAEGLNLVDGRSLFLVLIATLCLVVSNFFFAWSFRKHQNLVRLAEFQVGADILYLLVFFHFTGGIENPVIFVYSFPVVVAGIIMDRARCYWTALFAWFGFASLCLAEMTGLIGHTLLRIYPAWHNYSHLTHTPSYVYGVIALQFMILFFAAYSTTGIAERLRTEERHGLAVRQRSDFIMKGTGVGFAIWDRFGKPDWLNDQMKRWLGIPLESEEGAFPDLDHWSGGADGLAERAYRDGLPHSEERTLASAEGVPRCFYVTALPLRGPDGDIFEVVELVEDITERKRTNAEMARSARLASVGILATGLAHEIGNPLSSILTRLQRLEESQGNDPAFFRESLEVLKSQIARITRIVRGVAGVARPTRGTKTDCDVNAIIHEVLAVLRLHPSAKECEIGTELAQFCPAVYGVSDQIAQVFLNLGLNAFEAMPAGGKLTISSAVADGMVRVGFLDTGTGMAPDIRESVFDTFFTTRENGLGLGLSIVKNTMKAHGGRVDIDDGPNGGVAVSVAFPVKAS